MSLLRQLIWSVTIAIVAILVGTLALSTHSARTYLSEQLQAQSENAVSALALSLSQPSNQEPATQELLMSALFDTGQFQSIRMTASDGAVLFERQQKVNTEQQQAPDWFLSLLPLPTAKAHRAVSNGWQQLGSVEVTVDKQQAQTTLWQSSLRLGVLILIAGLVWGLFVGSLVRWFKRVLSEEIAQQVQRIGTEQTVADVDDAHQVQELRAVSDAIHDAYTRVQQHEKVQSARIEKLELETNSDLVTGLPNRKYFLNELNKALHSEDCAQGHVLLARQRDLQAMNVSMPRQEVDQWLQGVTHQVQSLLQHSNAGQAQLARLNGSDFALLLPGGLGPEGMHLIQQVRKLLQSLNVSLADGQWSRWAFVMTPYTKTDIVKEVLSRLDQGLMKAESAGHGDVEYADQGRTTSTQILAGEGDWQQILTMALQTPQQLKLAVQGMRSTSLQSTETWHEAALTLYTAQGQALDVAMFLPAAVRLGLSDAYDLKALELALQWLQQHADSMLVVRISLASLEQEGFMDAVAQLLDDARLQTVRSRLVLELDAYALELLPESTLAFSHAVSKLGAGIGLRRLDQAPKALLQISSMPLRYAKLGGYFAGQAMYNVGTLHLLEAMVATVQAQGARIYIVDAVDAKASDWLRSKGAGMTSLDA